MALFITKLKKLAPTNYENGKWQSGNYLKAVNLIKANFNNEPLIKATYNEICEIMQWATVCVCLDEFE